MKHRPKTSTTSSASTRPANTLAADFEAAAGSGNHPVFGVTPIAVGSGWHHAAATYDGATWNLYLDDALEATLVVNVAANEQTNVVTAVGTSLNTVGTAAGFFAGLVDEVRIWDVARTQAQIMATKNTTITSAQTNLIGAWNLDEGANAVLGDSSGNGITGAAVGSPIWGAGFIPQDPTALHFDGVNDYVTFGAAPSLGLPAFTLEAWIKRTGTGATTTTSGSGGGGLFNFVPIITKGRDENDGSNVDLNYFLGIDSAE